MESQAKQSLRKIPATHPPDTTADIGSVLKAARDKKGLSLDSVSQNTRISRKFLEALENNKFEDFPALAYLRGFLKSYCDYLEIEFAPLWLMVTAAETASSSSSETQTHAQQPSQPQRNERPEREPGSASTSPAAWALAAAALAAIILGLWALKVGRPPEDAKRQGTVPAALQPVHNPAEPDLQIAFRDDVWISVSVDGVQKFEGRVPRNSRQEWKGSKFITLRTSDPQSLKLTLNASPYNLPAPGAAGEFRIESP